MNPHLHSATLSASQAVVCMVQIAPLIVTANRRRASKQLSQCVLHVRQALIAIEAFALEFNRRNQ